MAGKQTGKTGGGGGGADEGKGIELMPKAAILNVARSCPRFPGGAVLITRES